MQLKQRRHAIKRQVPFSNHLEDFIKSDAINPLTASPIPKINAVCTPAVNEVLAMDGASGSATLLKKLFCDADIMVIAKAVPIEPDTCIKVFTMAVPYEYRLFRRFLSKELQA